MKSQDLYIGIGLMALSILAIIGSYHFPECTTWGASLSTAADAPYRASAGTFPRLVCLILFALSLVLTIRSLKTAKNAESPAPETGHKVTISREAVLFIISLTAYFLLLQPLGFAIATILFSLSCIFVFDSGNVTRRQAALMAVAFSCIVIVLFYRVLYVPLPRGMGIFRTISELVIFMKL